MKFPPCKICKHSKSKHGTAEVIGYAGWHKRRPVVEVLRCQDCYNFTWYGPTYEWEYDIPADTKVNWNHEYEGDNLALLELKSRRHELLNRGK